MCWQGFDITEKLSHCKHPVEVRNRAAGGGRGARASKNQPLQLRKTSLYTSVQASRSKEKGKGEGMETGDVWEGEIVENNGNKQKEEG